MKKEQLNNSEYLNPADQPIPMRQQLAYAFNEFASNPIYTLTLSFLTFFYLFAVVVYFVVLRLGLAPRVTSTISST